MAEKNNKDSRCTIRITPCDDEKLREYCNKTGKTKSDVVREALSNVFKNKGNQ